MKLSPRKEGREKGRVSSLIAAIAVALLFLGIVVTCSVLLPQEHQRALDYLQQEQAAETDHLSQILDSWIQRYQTSAFNYLDMGDVQIVLVSQENWTTNMQRLSSLMNNFCSNDAYVQSIMLYSNDRIKMISERAGWIIDDQSYHELYENLLTINKSTAFIYKGRLVNGSPCVLMSIVQPNSRNSGIAINTNLSALSELLFTGDAETSYYIRDAYGKELSVNESAESREQFSIFSELDLDGAQQTSLRRDDYIYAISTVASCGLQIVSVQKISEIMIWQQVFQSSLLILGAEFLVFALTVGVCVKYFTSPVDRLSRTIIRYADLPPTERIDLHVIANSAQQFYQERQSIQMQLNIRSWCTVLALPNQSIEGSEHLLFPDNHAYRQNHMLIMISLESAALHTTDGYATPELIRSVVDSALENSIGNHFFRCVIHMEGELFVVALREFEGDASLEDIDLSLQAAILRDAIHAVITTPIIILYSEISQHRDDYGQLYEKLALVLRYRLLEGNDWTGFSNLRASKKKEMVPSGTADSLLQAVKNCQSDLVVAEVEGLMQRISDYRLSSAITHIATVLATLDEVASNAAAVRKQDSINEYIDALYTMTSRDDIVNILVERCQQAIDMLSGIRKSSMRDILGRVDAYIEEHLTEGTLSVQYAAQYFGISPSYFSRLFNNAKGQSFPQYISLMRLERAKNTLNQYPDKDIKDIALEVGFNSASYFCSMFQKVYGMSPSKYRLQKTNE